LGQPVGQTPEQLGYKQLSETWVVNNKHKGRGCEICHETNPKRGFYPIFEDEKEKTHKICWDCYDLWCDEELQRERINGTKRA